MRMYIHIRYSAPKWHAVPTYTVMQQLIPQAIHMLRCVCARNDDTNRDFFPVFYRSHCVASFALRLMIQQRQICFCRKSPMYAMHTGVVGSPHACADGRHIHTRLHINELKICPKTSFIPVLLQKTPGWYCGSSNMVLIISQHIEAVGDSNAVGAVVGLAAGSPLPAFACRI